MMIETYKLCRVEEEYILPIIHIMAKNRGCQCEHAEYREEGSFHSRHMIYFSHHLPRLYYSFVAGREHRLGNNHLSGSPTLIASTPVTDHVTLFGSSIPDSLFTWLVAALFVLLVIILFLITFFYVRRQIRVRRRFAELNRRAAAEAELISQQEKEAPLQWRQRWQQAPPNGNNPASVAFPMGMQLQFQGRPTPGIVPSMALSDMPSEEISRDVPQHGNEKAGERSASPVAKDPHI